MTLVEFLLARIEEDEDDARVCRGPEWTALDHTAPGWGADQGKVELLGGGKPLATFTDYASYVEPFHIARHDPARVLAECEAKRRIVALHSWMGPVMAGDPVDDPKSCVTCADHVQPGSPTIPWPCPTLRALALPYADHPDYREEWRP